MKAGKRNTLKLSYFLIWNKLRKLFDRNDLMNSVYLLFEIVHLKKGENPRMTHSGSLRQEGLEEC